MFVSNSWHLVNDLVSRGYSYHFDKVSVHTPIRNIHTVPCAKGVFVGRTICTSPSVWSVFSSKSIKSVLSGSIACV